MVHVFALTISGFALILAILNGLPLLFIAAVGTTLGAYVWTLRRVTKIVIRTGIDGTQQERDRFAAIHRGANLDDDGRMRELSAVDIEALTLIRDGSGFELVGNYMAFDALTLRGDVEGALTRIKRAVTVADELRRFGTYSQPAFLSLVYLEAAYAAAAYAGDLDFALRAVAIGGKPHLYRFAYHKAMTAIWIRLAHRTEAENSFERAERAWSFWRRPEITDYPGLHLEELRAVFAEADLSPLLRHGVASDAFEEVERSSFFASHRKRAFLKASYVGFSILIFLTALLEVAILDGRLEDIGVTFSVLICFSLVAFVMGRRSIREVLDDVSIELSSAGIVHRLGNRRLWYSWGAIERHDHFGHRWLTKKGLHVMPDAVKAAGGRRKLPPFIPTGEYLEEWPDGTMESALLRFAPHLFEGRGTDNAFQQLV